MDMGRILIVDDEESIRLMLGDFFTNCGYEVVTAEDGEDALKKFSPGRFGINRDTPLFLKGCAGLCRLSSVIHYDSLCHQDFLERAGVLPEREVNRDSSRLFLLPPSFRLWIAKIDQAFPVHLKIAGTKPRKNAARAWLLSGPSPIATNLTNPNNIGINEIPVIIKKDSYYLRMPACSMAAIEIAP